MKRAILIGTAFCFALGALNSFADDGMQDGKKDAMEHHSMTKPAAHDKMDKMDKMGKADKMHKSDKPHKTDATDKMGKMENPGATQ